MEKRINELIEHLGLSPAQFADKIGVQRSSISHILSGRNKPSYDFIQKITETFPLIDANWLITGKGNIDKKAEPVLKTAKEHDLFNQLTNNNQQIKQIEHRNTELKSNQQPENKIIESKNNKKENIEFTCVNIVKTIIFIYDDNTFEIINKK